MNDKKNEKMKIKDLANETSSKLGLTSVQREALCKTYIGKHVELQKIIKDIEKKNIIFEDGRYPGFSHEGELCYLVNYDETKFGNQIMAYSRGDEIKITTKISSFSPSEFSSDCHCYLELLSINKISTAEERIKKQKVIDEKKERERIEQEKIAIEARQKSEGGCFIATVCYGDINHSEVLILRQYRDDVLLKSTFGKIAVNIYYYISPPISRLLKNSGLLKNIVRKYLLTPIVSKIQKKLSITKNY